MMWRSHCIRGLAAACLLFLGCSQGSPSNVSVRLPAALATDFALDRIVLDVTGADMPPIQETIPAANIVDPVSFNLDVPIGTNRTFLVRAVHGLQPLFTGLAGSNTVDVPAEGVQVPIDMQFVNYAEDAINTDVLVDSVVDPDISDLDILVGTGTDLTLRICPVVDAVFFRIGLEPIDPANSAGVQSIIEFDTDDDPTTGAPTTVIASLAGAIPTTFLNGSERTVTLAFDGQAALTVIRLEDVSTGTPVILAEGPNEDFNALLDLANDEMLFCISRTKFLGQDPSAPGVDIDPTDMSGVFNILTGRLDAAAGFIANDIAFETGTIQYDLGFDTSGL